MVAGAAIAVGYLSVSAEAGVRRLQEIPSVRRVVETIFLFSVIDSLTRHAASQYPVSTRRGSLLESLDVATILWWTFFVLIATAILVGVTFSIVAQLWGNLFQLIGFTAIAAIVLAVVLLLGRSRGSS
jgi:hypothetical protein